jgi:hypothetical protein
MHTPQEILAELYKTGQYAHSAVCKMWYWRVRQGATGRCLGTDVSLLSKDDTYEVVKSTFHKIAATAAE